MSADQLHRLRHALRCQHHHSPFSALLAEEDGPFVSASRVLDESCKLCGVPSRPEGNLEERQDYLGSDSALMGEKVRDLLVSFPERVGASWAQRVAEMG